MDLMVLIQVMETKTRLGRCETYGRNQYLLILERLKEDVIQEIMTLLNLLNSQIMNFSHIVFFQKITIAYLKQLSAYLGINAMIKILK